MAFPGYAAPTGFVVDAAVLLHGSTPMGATKGGLTWNPGKEIRHVEFDGLSTEIAGLHRILAYKPTISGNMKDLSAAAIGRYEPGSTSDGSSTNTYTMKPAKEFYASGDYLQDVTFKGNRSDGKAFVIKLAWAIVREYNITTPDRNEADVAITLEGVLQPGATDLELCPYTIQEEP